MTQSLQSKYSTRFAFLLENNFHSFEITNFDWLINGVRLSLHVLDYEQSLFPSLVVERETKKHWRAENGRAKNWGEPARSSRPSFFCGHFPLANGFIYFLA